MKHAHDALLRLEEKLEDYESRLQPPTKEVKVAMYLTNAWHKGHKLYLAGYFRTFWTDARLADSENPNIDLVLSNEKILESIWTPDLFFTNAKKDVLHQGGIILKSSTGEIMTSQQFKLKAYCPVTYESLVESNGLANCTLNIEPFMHTASVMTLAWKKEAKFEGDTIQAVRTNAITVSVGSKTYSSLVLNVEVQTGITRDVAKYKFSKCISED